MNAETNPNMNALGVTGSFSTGSEWFRTGLLVLVVLIPALVQMRGQGAFGTITGLVSDGSGAVVPGASVTITNEATNVALKVVTTSTGEYTVPFVKPGLYSVTVHIAEFETSKIEHVSLSVNQTARVNAVLKVGSVNTQVSVSGEEIRLNTEDSTVGQVISEEQVSDLPLNGRNFTSLMLLQPGAVQMAGPLSGEQSTRPGSGDSLSIGGGRPTGNQYLVDGLTINDVLYQTPAYEPSIDAIQEFTSQSETYSAQYGTSSSQINMSYKSGTNQLHGTAFDFLRNNFFDARSYFDLVTPVLRQNQFGYSLGGPVFIPKLYNGRNRTFFFANYEGLRNSSSSTGYETVPTTAERGGQFTTPITDPVTGLLFPNDQVPSNRVSTFASVMSQYIPTPNTNLPQGNVEASVVNSTQTDQQNYRFDQSFGTKNIAFGRYSRVTNSYITGTVNPDSGYNHPITAQVWQGTYIHTFTPSIINQTAYSHLNVAADQLGISVPQSVIDSLSLTGIYSPLVAPDRTLPNISVTNYLGFGGAVNTPWFNDQTTNEVVNSTTFIHGRQAMTFGLDYRRWIITNNTTTGFTGQWTFNGQISGDAYADFLLGYTSDVWATQPTSNSNVNDPGSPVNVVYSSIAPFFQDDWKLTGRFTLNLGLRYDWSSVPYEEKNHWSWLDPNIPGGGLCVADKSLITSGVGNGLYAYCGSRTAGTSQKRPFAPRVGFAYNPIDKWVVRSGYGIFFDTAETFEDIGSGNIYPYTIRTTYLWTLGQPLGPFSTANLFPNLATPGPVTTADLSFYEPTSQKRYDPYVQSWSLSIEHELAKRTKAEVYYAGSVGMHLNTRLDANQPFDMDPANPTPPTDRLPFPNFGLIVEEGWSSHSNYHSLNGKLDSNIGDNLNLVAVYTWSKSMDDRSSAASLGGDQAGYQGYMDLHRPRLDYSVSAYDVPQRFVASFLYKLPIGRGQRYLHDVNKISNLAVGGWQVNGIASFQSGFPFTVFAPDLGNYNEAPAQRAQLVGNPLPAGFKRTANAWFNTAAFAQPALGTYGNSSRDMMRMQGLNNFDFSVFKNAQFSERLTLQLRLEAFNALNRPEFYLPNVTWGTPTFGVISSASPGRIVQLAGKIIW